jgi:acetyl esterase/lipase
MLSCPDNPFNETTPTKTETLNVKKSYRTFIFIFLSFVCILTACGTQTPTNSSTSPPYLSKLGTVEKNVSYSNADIFGLKLDVYYPLTAPGPMPVVVYIHGGGWVGGDKLAAADSPEVTELVKRGFLVASINYGLAPQYSILEQIENAKCAIRFLRANTSRFGINPDKIGVLGESAGAHLAAVIGTADQSAGLEGVGGFSDQASRVEAVVDLYGPTDVRALLQGSPAIVFQELIGTSDPNSTILDKINPLTYVSAGDPPFLILQGDKDIVVPPSQSQILYDKLTATGVPATLVVVKNAGHSFTPVGGAILPTRIEITGMAADFFDRQLK